MFARILALLLIVTVGVALAARPSGSAGPEQVYVVKPADTLWSIAVSHYGGDPRAGVWRLERRNRLRTELLRPGQRLVLP